MRGEQLLFSNPALFQIIGELGAMFQVIADDLVDVSQLENQEILSDLLRSGRATERADYEIKRYASAGAVGLRPFR